MRTITVDVLVNAPVEQIWKKWTDLDSIIQWNQASADWHCPKAANDLRVGGVFSFTMAARDKSSSFDFEGTYTKVELHRTIDYTIIDGRKVTVQFEKIGDLITKITETFEIKSTHTTEQQKEGWGAILKSFKGYCEERK